MFFEAFPRARTSFVLLAALSLFSCGRTSRAGMGAVSAEARALREEQVKSAPDDRFVAACELALRRPNDERLARKCALLAELYLKEGRANGSAVLSRLRPVLASLDNSLEPCSTREEAAAVYLAAHEDGRAAELLVRTARECTQVRTAFLATEPLAKVRRCDDAVRLLGSLYPAAAADERTQLFDWVAYCSSDVTLRKNLVTFASADEVEGYFQLVKRRDEERRHQEELAKMEQIRQEQQEQAAALAQQNLDNCVGRCDADLQYCQQKCSGSGCSACSERYDLCQGACQ